MLSFYCAWLAKKRGSKYLELWQVIIAAGKGNIFYSENLHYTTLVFKNWCSSYEDRQFAFLSIGRVQLY